MCACCNIEKEGELRCQAENERVLWWCAQNYSGAQFIAPIPDQKLITSLSQYYHWGLGIRYLQIIHEYNITTTITIQLLTQSWKYKIGSSISLPLVNSNFWLQPGPPFQAYHEHKYKTNKKVSVACGDVYLNCPSFYFYHLNRRDFIDYFLWVSQSESSSLTPMMASFWLYHRPWMRTSPIVFNTHLPWNTYSSDLLCHWCIRGSPRTQLREKARRTR